MSTPKVYESITITHNYFNSDLKTKISDEVCFVYLNFAAKHNHYRIQHAVNDWNDGYHGVISDMMFKANCIDVDVTIKCLEFLNKYYVKS